MKIVNEKTIMDYAWEHAEKINEVRMLNKVRMCKKVIFPFEALGSNGSKSTETFYDSKSKSQYEIINWSYFDLGAPTKKEFRAWDKFALCLKRQSHKADVTRNKISSKWSMSESNNVVWDDASNAFVKAGRMCKKAMMPIADNKSKKTPNVERIDDDAIKVVDVIVAQHDEEDKSDSEGQELLAANQNIPQEAKLIVGADASAHEQTIAIAGVMHDAVTNEEWTHSRHTDAACDPNSCAREALGVLHVLLQAIEKIKNAMEHESTAYDDNEALVDKVNEDCFLGIMDCVQLRR